MRKTFPFVLVRLMLMLSAACFIVSCGDDDPTPSSEISWTKGTSTNQTFYADAASEAAQVKFNAAASWVATVKETAASRAGGSSVDWLTLSQYSGGAGLNAITISLKENTTGTDRQAMVRITCGETTLAMNVQQKAVKQQEPGGDAPKGVVSKITCKSWYGSEDDGEYTVEFFYDNQGRVARMVQVEQDEYDSVTGESGTEESKAEVTLTYGNGTVSYYIAHSVNGTVNPNEWVKGSATLDAQGRVVSGEYTDMEEDEEGDNEEYHSTYTLTYDANGYLVKCEGMDGDDPLTETMTWSAGNLTQVKWGRENGQDLIDRAVYGQVKNSANIDFNWFLALDSEGFDFATGDPYKIFAMLGMVGKRTANLATKVTETWGNVTTNTYETNGKGVVTKVTRQENEGSYVEKEEFTITYAK